MPILSWAHGDKTHLSFSGVISEGTMPVSGAVISIEKNGQVIQSAESDANGNFEISVEPYISRMDQVKITVHKKGYRPLRFSPVEFSKHFQIELRRQLPIPIIKPIGGSPSLSI